MKSGWIGEGGKACEEELRDFREGRKKKRKSVLGLNFLGGKCAASKRAAASHQRNYASVPSTAVPNVSNSSAAEFCDFGLRGGENQICLAPFLNAPNEGRDAGRREA